MDFSASTILCVGDVMLDRFLSGSVTRISPEAPIPVLSLTGLRAMLGGAGNVARNIAALGGQALLVGLVGTDPMADAVRRLIAETPGLTDHLVTTNLRPTSVKSRFSAGNQQIVRVDEELAFPASAPEAQKLMAAIEATIAQVNAVILSDYGKGVLTPEINAQTIALARKHGIPIFVDPKSADFTRYAGATCITPNLSELSATVGQKLTTADEIVAAARAQLERTGAQALIVTRSEQGMTLVLADGGVHHVPACAHEVFDVSGAGDTAIATLALSYTAGANLPRAMRIANVAAGIVVGKAGTATVSFPELQHSLDAAEPGGQRMSGFIPRSAAEATVDGWRQNGQTIGFTNGCFDIFHSGHAKLLAEARAQCSRLVVGINSDSSVRRLKGVSRPINALEERAAVLAELRSVDLVVPFDEDTPMSLIQALKPDVLIKGADYTVDKVVGADVVRAHGGRVHLVDLVSGRSTTTLIEKVRNRA